jgi:lysophosphatidate acyltransferase
MKFGTLLSILLSYSASGMLCYISLAIFGAAIVAVHQERRIWTSKGIPSLSYIGFVKVFLFNVCWMIGCLLGVVYVLLKHIVSFGTSDISVDSNRIVEDKVAKFCVQTFVGHVTVVGKEHLPPLGIIPAPVYIANHASQIDLGVVYHLNRRFKWISKLAVLYIPGVGLVMYLSKHVFIDRQKGKNTKSISNLIEQSNSAIQNGLPMFFFPQGTRRIVERLPAKDGAFIVAQTNHSTLIPISIDIPTNAWNSCYPINQFFRSHAIIPTITITIHPSIPSFTGIGHGSTATSNTTTEKANRELLKKTCMEQIYTVLPDYNSVSKVQ